MNKGVSIRAFATLEFKDAETDELLRTVIEENSLTQHADLHLSGRWFSHRNGVGTDFNYNNSSYDVGPFISSASDSILPCITSTVLSSKAYAIWNQPTHIAPNTVESQWTEISTNTNLNDLATPASVISKRVRFNQPATTTTINSIFLRSNIANYVPYSACHSWISLTTPCAQLPTEVLDITYRIEMYNTEASRLVNTPDVLWSSPEYNPAVAKSKWWRYNGNASTWNYNETVDIHSIQSLWYKKPEYTQDYYALTMSAGYAVGCPYLSSSATYPNSYSWLSYVSRYNSTTVTATSNNAEQSYVGSLCRIGGIYRGYGDTQTQSNGYYENMMYGFTDFLPKEFAYMPVQSIHNHSENAPFPFVDVNYLAAGAGGVSATEGTWTEYNGVLEWWRCDIKITGQVGTARYHMSRNIRGEFSKNTYGVAGRHQDTIPILTNLENYLTGASNINGGVSTDVPIMIGSHYRGHRQNVVEWSDTEHVIAHDEFGITIMNLITQDYKNFDSSSTPALPVTGVNQIATLANGDVYVACRVNGLYKIVDILGTPIITKVVCGELNINDDMCYAVSEGYNNSIWAAFEGGLAHTTNGGTTWTSYTTQNGGWVHKVVSAPEEIATSTNWSTIKMIRVDVESPSHKLGIIRSSTAYTAMLIWWTPTMNAIDFNKSNTYANALFAQLIAGTYPRTNFFKCSRAGGLWIQTVMDAPLDYVINVNAYTHNNIAWTSGTNSYYSAYSSAWPRGSNSSNPLKGNTFFYDNNSKPYYSIADSSTRYHSKPGNSKLYTDNGSSSLTFVTRISAGDYNTYGETDFIYRGENILFSFERAAVSAGYRGPVIAAGVTRAGSNFSSIVPINYYTDDTTSNVFDASSYATDNWYGRHTPTRDMNWNEYRWNGSAWVDGWHQTLTDQSAFSHNGVRKGFECESHYFRGRSRIEFDSVLSEDFSAGMTMVGTFNCDATRPLGQRKQHTLFSTDRFYIGRYDSNSTTSPGQMTLRDSNFVNEFNGSILATDDVRYAISVSSVASDSYDFKMDNADRSGQGVFMRPVGNSIVGVLRTAAVSGAQYHTIYSPVYNEIDNGDFAIQCKLNIPTTLGPGRGVRFGVRFGDKPFTSISDTYSASGVDFHGFRSPTAFCVYFAGGTTAPVFFNHLTTITPTVNSAITANDQNGVNDIEIRYTIVGADLVIKVVRIKLAGTPVTNVLYTCTVAGAGTLYAGLPGIIGITPEWVNASMIVPAVNAPQLTDFVLYDYTTISPFGRTAYTSTVNVYANGSATPVLTYAVGAAIPLNTATKLWCGFESHSLYRGMWGDVLNPQVWNVTWNTADVAADYASLTGTSVIDTVNAPIAACKARYNMAQSLVETKTTHAGVEAGPSGIGMQFNNLTADGISTYAFFNNDFYSWGMFNGLLKDNAITANFSATWFKGCNADLYYNKLTSILAPTVNATTIVNITSTPITEVAVFSATQTFHGPGFISQCTSSSVGTNYHRGITAQSLPASTDGSFEAGVNMRQSLFFGLQTNIDGSVYPTVSTSATGAFIQLNVDGSYICRVNGTTIFTSAAAAYQLEDRFKVARTDSGATPAFKFYLNSVEVASTTTGVQTARLAPVVSGMAANPAGLHEATVTYVRDFPSLEVGNYNLTDSLRSGKYGNGFLMLHPDATMYDITIDGSPAIVLFSSSDIISSIPPPASIPAGTVYVLAKLGIMAFSTGDIAKTVVLNKAPMLYWK